MYESNYWIKWQSIIWGNTYERHSISLQITQIKLRFVSVGSAENKDVQGIVVIYTDVYGNEQEAKVLVSKSTDMNVGDVISIRYDPSDTEKIEILDNTLDTALPNG